MNKISENIFVGTLDKFGILIDPSNPNTVNLSFDKNNLSRFWNIPLVARKIPLFVKIILDFIGEWESIFVWKPLSSWSTHVNGERINDDVQAIIYRGIGIPDSNDILQFARNEQTHLIALVMNQMIFGWYVGDDMYLIPNTGNCFFKTSHHDIINVEFADEKNMLKFIKSMASEEYYLPKELPDNTFKKPDWM